MSDEDESQKQEAGKRTNAELSRTTVNLTARASKALDETVKLTGDSKTDVINHAVKFYAEAERIIEGGGAVYFREEPGGELIQQRIL